MSSAECNVTGKECAREEISTDIQAAGQQKVDGAGQGPGSLGLEETWKVCQKRGVWVGS